MENIPKSTPRDVFYHLLAIVTLYVSVVSFIATLWQYINVIFPDQLEFYFTRSSDIIRQSIAALFVVWPVYLLITWLLWKEVKKAPERSEIKIRKWLFYLTLFIAAVTIIVDFITLIQNFLGGDLTLKFTLKVLVILAVAGVVFGYYLWDLRSKEAKPSKIPRLFAWTVSAIIIFVIIGGFFIIGSPAKQRAMRFDERRTNDLQSLQDQIIQYWQKKDALPPSLDDLKDNISGFIPPRDPKTDGSYEYQATGDLSFELCAEFNTASAESETGLRAPVAAPSSDYFKQNWSHQVGRACFQRTIDPDIYRSKELKPLPAD